MFFKDFQFVFFNCSFIFFVCFLVSLSFFSHFSFLSYFLSFKIMNGLLFILIILPFIVLFESSLSCSGVWFVLSHSLQTDTMSYYAQGGYRWFVYCSLYIMKLIMIAHLFIAGENNNLNNGLTENISYSTTQNETSYPSE